MLERQPHTGLRNLILENRLDPEGNLPHVSLVKDYKLYVTKDMSVESINIKSKKHGRLGYLDLVVPSGENPSPSQLDFIFITNRGFAKATYLELLKYLNGKKLESGALNDATIHIWEWLVEKRVARKIPDTNTRFESII